MGSCPLSTGDSMLSRIVSILALAAGLGFSAVGQNISLGFKYNFAIPANTEFLTAAPGYAVDGNHNSTVAVFASTSGKVVTFGYGANSENQPISNPGGKISVPTAA